MSFGTGGGGFSFGSNNTNTQTGGFGGFGSSTTNQTGKRIFLHVQTANLTYDSRRLRLKHVQYWRLWFQHGSLESVRWQHIWVKHKLGRRYVKNSAQAAKTSLFDCLTLANRSLIFFSPTFLATFVFNLLSYHPPHHVKVGKTAAGVKAQCSHPLYSL